MTEREPDWNKLPARMRPTARILWEERFDLEGYRPKLGPNDRWLFNFRGAAIDMDTVGRILGPHSGDFSVSVAQCWEGAKKRWQPWLQVRFSLARDMPTLAGLAAARKQRMARNAATG